jgi:ABC-type polysaccharide/polyol phosphate export permease
MVIVLSGGANPQMNTLSVLEIFGTWSIMEIAFNRGLITSFKYSGIGETLGIRLRLLVIGAYSTVWLEILLLLALLNTWSVYDQYSVLTLLDYFQIFSCLFSLLALSLPFSYFVSILSRNKIDLRYVIPVFFKFLVFSTPLFSSFHDNFSFVGNLLRFNPLNYCFSFVTNPSLSLNVSFFSFFIAVIFGYLLFSMIRDKIEPLAWKRLDDL